MTDWGVKGTGFGFILAILGLWYAWWKLVEFIPSVGFNPVVVVWLVVAIIWFIANLVVSGILGYLGLALLFGED